MSELSTTHHHKELPIVAPPPLKSTEPVGLTDDQAWGTTTVTPAEGLWNDAAPVIGTGVIIAIALFWVLVVVTVVRILFAINRAIS